MRPQSRRLLPFLGAIALVTAALALSTWPVALTGVDLFPDGDDALRLAQVREFLARPDWFDVRIPDIGDGAGLVSHWSRLLDAPIAGLILLVGSLTERAAAEQLVTLVWPPLVLFAFAFVLMARAQAEGGWLAVLVLTGLCLGGASCLAQFQFGRIDHHNVQIACAVLATLLATTGRTPNLRSQILAGSLAGFGLAIGYEALPLTLLVCSLIAGRAMLDPNVQRQAEAFFIGFAGMLSLALLATAPPPAWLDPACDALGSNVVAAALVASTGVVLAGRMAPRLGILRTLLFVLTGVAAAATFAAVQPACLGGPFAAYDPAIQHLLLDRVSETYSILDSWRETPSIALGLAVSLGAGVILQAIRTGLFRDLNEASRLVVAVAVAGLALYQAKFMPYAQILLYFFASVAIANWPKQGFGLSAGPLAIGYIALLNPPMIASLAGPLIAPPVSAVASPMNRACLSQHRLDALRAVPPGRLLASPDLGAVIALGGYHRALVGNYHRLDKELIRAAKILDTPAAKAAVALADWKIDYIVLCSGSGFFKDVEEASSLADALVKDQPLPYLTPVDTGPGNPLKLWRVLARQSR